MRKTDTQLKLNRKLSQFFLILMVFVYSIPLGAVAEVNISTVSQFQLLDDPDVQAMLVASLATHDATLRKAVEDEIVRTKPLIVFVHGILGSALYTEKNGRTVNLWGRSSDENANDDERAHLLSYCSEASVNHKILHEYDTRLLATDVYGTWIRKITHEVRDADILFFDYDWRKPIRELGQDFEDWLIGKRTHIRNRPVLLVAHSMGGLVVTEWYFRHYNNRTDDVFGLENIIFVGTPHVGAPSALKTLLSGYSADDSLVPDFVTKYLTAPLQYVGHTFPSLYHLLPYPGDSVVMSNGKPAKVFTDGKTAPFNLFNADHWKALGFSPSMGSRPEHGPCRSLQAALGEARDFHQAMDKHGPVPHAVYCFSSDKATPETLDVTAGQVRRWLLKNRGGDGRVLAESAKNKVRLSSLSNNAPKNKLGMINYCYAEGNHSEILDNPGLYFVLKETADTLLDRRDRKVAKAASENPALAEMLKSMNIGIIQRGATESGLASGPQFFEAQSVAVTVSQTSGDNELNQWIKQHNYEILGGEGLFPSDTQSQLGFYQEVAKASRNLPGGRYAAQEQIALRLFSEGQKLTIANTPELFFAAVNNIGHIQIQKSNNSLAAQWLANAVELDSMQDITDTNIGNMLLTNKKAAEFRARYPDLLYKDEYRYTDR